MQGDKILVEEHHIRAAEKIVGMILPEISASKGRYTITVGGESGSGKSETAQAIADALEKKGVRCAILQQDDFYVYPPRTNDRTRRNDLGWVGPQEVHLDVLDNALADILAGKDEIEKPLVNYDKDSITIETLDLSGVKVTIAEGTYTTLLRNVNTRVFIARNYLDTRAHREKRIRHSSELDDFTERVLRIEHEIISSHRARSDIIVTRDYGVEKNDNRAASAGT